MPTAAPVGVGPPAFAAYLRHFAAGAFFEAHEDLEVLWWERDSDPFLQGLILFAAAFVKLQRGSAPGAAKHFRSAMAYLRPYLPVHCGVDVEAVVAHARAALEALCPYLAHGGPPLPTDALGGVVPRFTFRVGAEVSALAAPAPGYAPAPRDLERAIAACLAARRAAGQPVGPASWGAVVKDVTRRTGGRVPREALRAAVRRALAAECGSGAAGAGKATE